MDFYAKIRYNYLRKMANPFGVNKGSLYDHDFAKAVKDAAMRIRKRSDWVVGEKQGILSRKKHFGIRIFYAGRNRNGIGNG